MNDFSYLTDDAVGRLATVLCEEFFEENIDTGADLNNIDCHDKTTV